MKKILIFIILTVFVTICYSQNKKAYRIDKKTIRSGNHSINNNKNSHFQDSIVLTYNVTVNDATWMRLIFSNYNLGNKSYLIIKSLKDGSTQIHNQKTLSLWRQKSAGFNGGEIEVKLVVKDSRKNIYFNIDSVIVGGTGQSVMGTSSLCGADNRVASNDARVGRIPVLWRSNIGHCTVWLVSNGAILTAGHCVDMSSNGIIDLLAGDFIEFNVPPSNADGIINLAAAQDQYPIDINNITIPNGWQIGADWAVLRCMPNANTGLLPHQAQGFFYRMTRERPPINTNVSVTGYGIDDDPIGTGPCIMINGTCRFLNNTNATQQTNSGPYVGENSNGGRFWHQYSVDTEPANSGSPIIWDANNNFTIGIHTNGGCTATGGSNSGTSFEHDPLENALQDFHSTNTVYVDFLSLSPTEDGSVFSPFNTIQEGINSTQSGGDLYITTGTYNGSSGMLINKAMTILPPSSGNITINP